MNQLPIYTTRNGNDSEGARAAIHIGPAKGRADGCWRWGKSFMLSGVSSCYRVELLGLGPQRGLAARATSNGEIRLPTLVHTRNISAKKRTDTCREQRRLLTGHAKRRADADSISRQPCRHPGTATASLLPGRCSSDYGE